MAKQGYIRKEVSRILDMKPHTIQLYTDRGIVTPDISAPKGRGTTRIYSERNILQFAIVRELGGMGVKLAIIKRVLSMITELSQDLTFGKGRCYLFLYDHHDKNRLQITIRYAVFPDRDGRDRNMVMLEMANYRSAIVLDLSNLRDEIAPRL